MAAIESYTHTYDSVHSKTARIDDQAVFYREASTVNAPAIPILHGFPSSSNMFPNPMPQLAGSFRLIAPSYPQRITGLIVQNGNAYEGDCASSGSNQDCWAIPEELFVTRTLS